MENIIYWELLMDSSTHGSHQDQIRPQLNCSLNLMMNFSKKQTVRKQIKKRNKYFLLSFIALLLTVACNQKTQPSKFMVQYEYAYTVEIQPDSVINVVDTIEYSIDSSDYIIYNNNPYYRFRFTDDGTDERSYIFYNMQRNATEMIEFLDTNRTDTLRGDLFIFQPTRYRLNVHAGLFAMRDDTIDVSQVYHNTGRMYKFTIERRIPRPSHSGLYIKHLYFDNSIYPRIITIRDGGKEIELKAIVCLPAKP